MKFEDFNLDELFSSDKLIEMKRKQVTEKYTNVIAQVYDKKRDEKLSEYFDNEVVNTSTIIEIIDEYEQKKNGLIQHFINTVKFVKED